MPRVRLRYAAALVSLMVLAACSRTPPSTAAPPPARRTDCAGPGVVQLEGVFAMTYGDPPGEAGRPRTRFAIVTPEGATVVLLIGEELLGPHDAGRALQGRRVDVAGDVVSAVPRTLRVCAITPL